VIFVGVPGGIKGILDLPAYPVPAGPWGYFPVLFFNIVESLADMKLVRLYEFTNIMDLMGKPDSQ
jgi:hypothetical protein